MSASRQVHRRQETPTRARRWGRIVAGFGLGMALLAGLSCASRSTPTPRMATSQETLATRTFSAVLFPYIPDSGQDNFASLISTLEDWFEAQNPDIDLTVTIDPNMDLYSLDTLSTLLGSGSEAVNMVEVDTILFGELVSQNLLQPLPFDISDFGFFPTAVEPATVNSTTYGVPTYLCGNYIYSWDSELSGIDSGQGLIDFLSENPNPSATPLIGNFKGSWTLPSFYVDSWADTHTNDPSLVSSSFNLPLDSDTMAIFSPVVNLCGTDGGLCLSGAYKDNTGAETLFAQNTANGFVGYSERLYYILEARGGDITLPTAISAPVGVGSNPVMFVDALVLNKSCTGQCATDAETFSTFMSKLAVRNMIAFSEDVSPTTFPRYLLQALKSFYASAPGSENLIYQQLAPYVALAQAIPNQGFPDARLELNPALEQALTGTTVIAAPSAEGRRIGGIKIRRAPARFPDIPPR